MMPAFAQYTLTEPLQVGRTYVLYKGYRNAGHEPVLIKLCKAEHPSEREIAGLRHELLTIRELRADGILQAQTLEQLGSACALILEDFAGQPLAELLRGSRIALAPALDIAVALADGVGTLHDHLIIHKDLKPASILVNLETRAVKLTDFAIATRLAQEAQQAVRPDALEGTLAYMSPEQTGRMNRSLDYRTDLYSLGVTLYELFTGVLPFPTTDPMELVHSHIARTPPPLHERAAGIPEPLSAVVMKLLAKAAEERYQSAHGLKTDLELCRQQLVQTGRIASFALGGKDVHHGIRIVQKLYGRQAECDALRAAFARTSAGETELVLLSGYAGVGKTALVGELRPMLSRGGGFFAMGKFDQRTRNVPFTGVAAALRELVRHLLTESAAVLAKWRSALLTALGENGQLLIELIPELQMVIGPQTPVPALGLAESQNRFELLFQNFLRVFAAQGHPVVLFLDDLQWADPASLRLLYLALTSPDCGRLLIIGAYRDHEVLPGDPLAVTLGELRQQAVALSELKLLPLGLPSAEQLVAEALSAGVAEVQPLARLVFERTQGNPLFMLQFLRSLHDNGLIKFDRPQGAFVYDLEGVQAALVADNVVDFMTSKILQLAPRTRRVLQLAACIGFRFDLRTLAVINELGPAETAAALWEALTEGLVLPLDAGYQLAAEADVQPAAQTLQSPMFELRYRFLHDRVQQAAYAFTTELQRRQVHLQIGQLLCTQLGAAATAERLLEIVDHLNIGAPELREPGERIELAQLNLIAGKRTKATAAYQAAAAYLAAGTALLPAGNQGDEYRLFFALHTELAECQYLLGQFKEAEARFELTLARAEHKLDRAHVYKLLIVLYTMRGELAAALRIGRAALALFGVTLAESDAELRAAFDAELVKIKANLGGRRIAELIDAPQLTDPDLLALLELLVKLRPASFIAGTVIASVIIAMPVNLCLQHGQSELCEPIYSGIGLTLISLRGMYEEAREFFRLSTALAERSSAVRFRCASDVLLAGHAHFFLPFQKAQCIFERARRVGLQTGDFLFASFACYHTVMFRMCAGENLSGIREELERFFPLMQQTRNEFTTAILVVARQLVAALMGATRSPTSLSDSEFDEEAHLLQSARARVSLVVAYCHYARLLLATLYGDYATALVAAARTRETAGTAAFFSFATDVPFYSGLALTGLYPTASAEDKVRYSATLAEHQAQLARWAEHCPENYLHKQLLLSAEVARVSGQDAAAGELYASAIAAAQTGEFTHHAALANELAARHALGRGQTELARRQLGEAYQGYLRWGATAKASDLTAQYAALLAPPAAPSRASLPLPATTEVSETNLLLIDTVALVRAMQTIADETVLDHLLDKLMRIVVANAGADRGALLLQRDDKLRVAATLRMNPDVVQIHLTDPGAAAVALPDSIVQYVERTREPVVLDDVAVPGPFSGDPYLLRQPPKSLLCLALSQKGSLKGLLYLENHALTGAFNRGRVELCAVLAAHAAIAVENALLIEELRRRTAALSDSHHSLNQAYEALSATHERLSTANQQLQRELRERAEAEAARAVLQAELHRVQAPLIPITDRIMVMPLIGKIDQERAEQILATALDGVERSRAAVVILDITGVETVEGSVIGTLVNTANALRLLGTQAVITGIRPQVAQALVHMGTELGTLVTRATLQSGIAYAMERLGKKRGPGSGSGG